jgi:hypothetical protein
LPGLTVTLLVIDDLLLLVNHRVILSLKGGLNLVISRLTQTVQQLLGGLI